MKTIGELSRRFKISRTALLYYDSIDLLSPTTRTSSSYRLYSDDDENKLKSIMTFREIGIPLQKIKKLIEINNETEIVGILMSRIDTINRDIADFRVQQSVIIEILQNLDLLKKAKNDRNILTKIGKMLGIDKIFVQAWRQIFEHNSPNARLQFLKMIGFSKKEIDILFEKVINESK